MNKSIKTLNRGLTTGWQAVSLDIDLDTGDAYVALNRQGHRSHVVRVDSSAGTIIDQCVVSTGASINSIRLDQGTNGLLPFYFETVDSRREVGNVGFDFVGVNPEGEPFSIGEPKATSTQIPCHLDSVDVMVWGRSDYGLKKTRSGANGTFETAPLSDPGQTIRSPVFSWTSSSIVRGESILASLDDGSYSVLDMDTKAGKFVERKRISPSTVPLGGKPATGMLVDPSGQTVYLSNPSGVAEVDLETFLTVAAVETSGDLADNLIVGTFLGDDSHGVDPDGGDGDIHVMGCSPDDGRLFVMGEITTRSSSSSYPVWTSSSSSSTSMSSASSNSSSSKSSSSKSSSSSSSVS